MSLSLGYTIDETEELAEQDEQELRSYVMWGTSRGNPNLTEYDHIGAQIARAVRKQLDDAAGEVTG